MDLEVLSFQTLLNRLSHVNEYFSSRHKKIIYSLQSSDINTSSVKFSQDFNNKVIIDFESMNVIIESINELIETDLKFTKYLKSFQHFFDRFAKVNQTMEQICEDHKTLKNLFENLRNLVSSSVTQIHNCFKVIQLNEKSRLPAENKEKLRACLQLFLSTSILKKKNVCNIDSFLLEPFRIDAFDSHFPKEKLKKYKDLVLHLGKNLLDIYKSPEKALACSNPTAHKKNLANAGENDRESKKKTVIGKVNRLVNRGSLSQEEAKRVIKSLNKKESKMTDYSQNEEFYIPEDPLTETRVNPGSNESLFTKDVRKVFKFPKKGNRSSSVIKKKKITNESISRNHSSAFIRSGTSTTKVRNKIRSNV